MSADRHTSPGQVVSLVGLWQNGTNAVIRPDRQVAVAEYWWRKWLPLLGMERWMLVTVLRWLYAQAVDLDAPRQAAVTLEFKVPELAEALGMSVKTVYRLLDSEPIEDEKPWRRLALPKRARAPEEERRRTELLRLFIPRLRYTAERRDGVTRRTGMMVELVLDVLPAPEDAEALGVQIPQRGISTPENGEVQIPQRGISTQVLIPKREIAPVQIPQRGTHACLLANIPTTTTTTPPPLIPPPRKPSRYPLSTLKNQFPIQPGEMAPDEAFNLALDRALALLPPKIRKGAEDALYALAAEAHPAALEAPSRYWPDAGGAGWVVDAVVDAKAARTEIGSVHLIRAIVERWMQQGSPYSLSSSPESASSDPSLAGWEDAVRSTWEAATDKPITDGEVDTLLGLLGPGDGRTTLSGLLGTIITVGRRFEDPTVETVVAVVEGRLDLPPQGDDGDRENAVGEVVEAVRPEGPGFARPDEEDPVLAEVARWYLSEIGTITEGVADQLRALVREYPNLEWWREAFEAVIRSNVRRLDYVVGCLERAKAGKRPIRPAKRRPARKKAKASTAATGRPGKPPAAPVDEDEVERLRRQYEEWVRQRQGEATHAEQAD